MATQDLYEVGTIDSLRGNKMTETPTLSKILKVSTVALIALVVSPFPGTEARASVQNGLIAFISERDGNSEIYVMNEDGTNQKRITNDPADDMQPIWSPDGKRIMFTRRNNTDGAYGNIFVMDENGSNVKQLTDGPDYESGYDWSPDGSKILFCISNKAAGKKSDVYMMDADGSNWQQLTDNPEHDCVPDWSPDGSKILFTSTRDGNYEIYSMNADGSNEQRLTNYSESDWTPKWSPDGTKIVYSSDINTNPKAYNEEIIVMDADGSNRTNLTELKDSQEGRPEWSPDGSQIVYESNYSGSREIFKMNADGTKQMRLTKNTSIFDAFPSWQPVQAPPEEGSTPSEPEPTPSQEPPPSRKTSPSFKLIDPALDPSKTTVIKRSFLRSYLIKGLRGSTTGYTGLEAGIVRITQKRLLKKRLNRCYRAASASMRTACNSTSIKGISQSSDGTSFIFKPVRSFKAMRIVKGTYQLTFKAKTQSGTRVTLARYSIKAL